MEIANSKVLLVEAFDEDGKFFIAFNKGNYEVTSIEHLPGNSPATTVHIFKDIDEFMEKIVWLDWIKEGIKNTYIKSKIK